MTTPRSRAATPDWLILALACIAQFMVVLDVSVVNVALPAMRTSLGFSATGLQWVVNAYTLAFAGFLLLGGRAADLFGRRRVFLVGLGLFTLASLAGGLAQTQLELLLARTAQGLGGAVLSPATLTILTTSFREPARRARALGIWSAVAGAGGAAGALLGGVLTDLAGWRWILFINVPIGVLTLVAARAFLPESRAAEQAGPLRRALDVPGAVLVTGGLMALVYAIVNTDVHPWGSARTLGTLAGAVVLLAVFLARQARWAATPLMPLRLFALRSVSSANAVMLLVGAAIFASWYFLSLYLQGVLGYSPLQAGLAFVPQTLAIIAGAQISSRLVGRLGPRRLLMTGPLIAACGLFLLSGIGAHADYPRTLLVPSMLVTFGVGLSFTPLALAATAGVGYRDAGLASGLLNTARQVGGSIGLAALAAVATARTAHLQLHGDAVRAALAAGYGRAFLVSGVVAVAAAVMATTLPRLTRPPVAVAPAPEPHGVVDEELAPGVLVD